MTPSAYRGVAKAVFCATEVLSQSCAIETVTCQSSAITPPHTHTHLIALPLLHSLYDTPHPPYYTPPLLHSPIALPAPLSALRHYFTPPIAHSLHCAPPYCHLIALRYCTPPYSTPDCTPIFMYYPLIALHSYRTPPPIELPLNAPPLMHSLLNAFPLTALPLNSPLLHSPLNALPSYCISLLLHPLIALLTYCTPS